MMSLAEIIEIVGAAPLAAPPAGEIAGVSTDTRTLAPGELFIALKGPRFDGHDYLPQAFARGAVAAVVSAAPPSPPAGTLLTVSDTLLALGKIAAAWRRKFDIPVIAVTGSVGKTTTKEMIASILSAGGDTLKTHENYNNEIGVPLTLLQLRARHTAAVLELAMRAPGQIRYLSQMVAPTVGVITNIGLSHLELLSSHEAIARAKAEIFEGIAPGGHAVLPIDSEHFPLLKEKAAHLQITTFGAGRGDFCAEHIESDRTGLTFNLWLPAIPPAAKGAWHTVALPAFGKHNAVNALSSAAAARCAGASPAQILRGLENFMTVAGRMRILKAPAGFTIIDDCYNASPDSMAAALQALADTEGQGKIAVLGDMRELGDDAPALHRSVGRQAAGIVDLALLVGVGELGREIAGGAADAMSSAALQEVSDAPAALALLADMVHPGDVVLVKASRAMGLEKVVEGLMALPPKE